LLGEISPDLALSLPKTPSAGQRKNRVAIRRNDQKFAAKSQTKNGEEMVKNVRFSPSARTDNAGCHWKEFRYAALRRV